MTDQTAPAPPQRLRPFQSRATLPLLLVGAAGLDLERK